MASKGTERAKRKMTERGTREVTDGWTGLRTLGPEQSRLAASFRVRILLGGEAEPGTWGC